MSERYEIRKKGAIICVIDRQSSTPYEYRLSDEGDARRLRKDLNSYEGYTRLLDAAIALLREALDALPYDSTEQPPTLDSRIAAFLKETDQ